MDRITRSLLNEFTAAAGLESLPESQQFEHWCAALVAGIHVGETIDTHDIVAGSGADTGLDAIAIIVNGALVADPEMVTELAEANGFVDATFVFLQAETTSGFSTAKLGTFGFGVLDFFQEVPTMPRNDAVRCAAEIMEAVFKESGRFKRGNPNLRLHYATTGKWTDDANLVARARAVEGDLKDLNLFRSVQLDPLDAAALHSLYRASKNAISREFEFADKIGLSDMPGVKEAYLGVVSGTELLSLLTDEAGGVLKSIFYDNVRDWQQYNSVNSRIRDTLRDPVERERFALMNNGVTIIAKSVRPTGSKMHIEDYQVVNGCQTSHVLFHESKLIDAKVKVPLRVISTEDEDVVASVVRATNSQTEVKAEQLIALSEFQKKLEAFFASFPPAERLYYERRSRQYNDDPAVEKTRIVPPQNLIRAYATVVRGEPHRTTRSYRTLLNLLGTDIFGPEHQLEPYYLAASLLYRLDFAYRNNVIPSIYRPARYHILYAARMLMNPNPAPPPNSRDAQRFAQAMLEQVWDADKSAGIIQRAARFVGQVASGDFDRDKVRTQTFTESVARAIAQEGTND